VKLSCIAGLVLGLVLSPVLQADDGLGYKGKNNDGLAPDELLSKLRSDGETQIREEKDWIVASSEKLRTIWSFPPKGHPAYPSYVKREVVEKGGALYMETSVRCGAAKPQCDKLVKDFIELNARVQSEVDAE
jgi:hypothetical protein